MSGTGRFFVVPVIAGTEYREPAGLWVDLGLLLQLREQ